MSRIKRNQSLAQTRKIRVRSKLYGSATRPRLTIFRSNQHLYLQVIDDDAQQTLVAVSDVIDKSSSQKTQSKKVESKKTESKITKTERSILVAQELLQLLQKKGIKTLVFDRGAYKYHGRVKAVAETLREGGIQV
ncbi:MAG: 50S ribosomal protein L18 [Candidatus Pacebacteria bacterium RIFOXYB1_FULL_39_46]|nr:MAG: 50S ribosomal protein L18 [Candidatus Pacebacteria bacterium RIFOXYB1_FULL_39_46]OGJ39019.1 MAG: 50S ribosomal protein L18 [Candidatus Pacebacteria bacterium RIFOXYA1_FULL_38_18]OGJ39990.1 MAG: 50S ribosomal protein L18 [Candidatus Pacebacteria bacterium RIFOXYD1_FULL_39_27]OGJ40748.1 MAG: 50S ribosomal protein L18 [Candidatus Pacebacteria bacterium RIFOXYC1_FULL_39_21]